MMVTIVMRTRWLPSMSVPPSTRSRSEKEHRAADGAGHGLPAAAIRTARRRIWIL